MKVKFVRFKGELLALFPNRIELDGNYILSYESFGQHGIASKSLMKLRYAKKEEYMTLLNELKSIGYDNLEVMNERRK